MSWYDSNDIGRMLWMQKELIETVGENGGTHQYGRSQNPDHEQLISAIIAKLYCSVSRVECSRNTAPLSLANLVLNPNQLISDIFHCPIGMLVLLKYPVSAFYA
jgi:hypothetical protein